MMATVVRRVRRTVPTARRLGAGDVAPAFEAAGLDGTVTRVPAAGSWILISFLRYASCPMCNLRIHELTLATSELASHGVAWVGVFHSPRRRLERHVRADAVGHTLADPGRALYGLYGVGHSWRGMVLSMLVPAFYWRFLRATALGFWGGAIDDSVHSMPADFLVSPDGRIRLAHYGKHIGDHAHVSAVTAAVRAVPGRHH